ncbi:hypothetical protein E4U57_002235 [Claviceps arundinis]|uniref:BRCT domain-containing protein n=1 Tax=Claviceps arundinis TaxID=1623583 RepID=A0ABQ7PLD4_9HYPO|nr:hypothetical protein E4U57_002235 [Claviceps arundinis]
MLRGPTVRHRGFSPRQFNFQNTFKTYNNNVLPAGDMTRLKLLAQAEKVAFEASNDTQDSQAILDALKAQFGVGTTSCSPHHIFKRPSLLSGPTRTTQRPLVGRPDQDKDAIDYNPVSPPRKQTTINNRDDVLSNVGVNAPQRHGLQDAPVNRVDHDDDAAAAVSYTISHEKLSATLSAEHWHSLVPAGLNMDGSQQTPTQINNERDYDTFCAISPSSGADCTQFNSNGEPRLLDPDETGAVNFGNLSQFPRPSSQISEDGGFENSRGQWRLPTTGAATPTQPHNAPDSLETPALSRNPFGTTGESGAVPFGATQLFGQTQLLSSAVKLTTPTSSRPSPAAFFTIVASPLKNRTNVSSPTDIRTSSPARLLDIRTSSPTRMPDIRTSSPTTLPDVPATAIKDNDPFTIAENTPVPHQSQNDDLIPESPTRSRLTLGYPQPMAYYEPMKHSQERKGCKKRSPKSGHVSDSDDETFQMLERKRRVERKRAAAAKEMDKVSFVRTQQRKPLSPPMEQAAKRRKVSVAVEHNKNEEIRADSMAQFCIRDSGKPAPQPSQLPSVKSTMATPGEDVPGVGLEADEAEKVEEAVEVVAESAEGTEEPEALKEPEAVKEPQEAEQTQEAVQSEGVEQSEEVDNLEETEKPEEMEEPEGPQEAKDAEEGEKAGKPEEEKDAEKVRDAAGAEEFNEAEEAEDVQDALEAKIAEAEQAEEAEEAAAETIEETEEVEEAAEALVVGGSAPTATTRNNEPRASVNDEVIPATSPLRSSPAVFRRDAPSASDPELPTLRRSETEKELDTADSSSLPPTRQRPRRTYGRRGREKRTRLSIVSSADTDANGGPVDDSSEELPQTQPLDEQRIETEKSDETVQAPGASAGAKPEPQPRNSTRSTPQRSRVVHREAMVAFSSSTDPTETPAISPKTTPGAHRHTSATSDRPVSINLTSAERSPQPLRERATRRQAVTCESPPPLAKSMRLSRRSLRLEWESTDDLHRSPSRSCRSFRPASLGSAHRSRRLFEGMIFALSFSDNPQRSKLEAKMTQAGATIIHEGFQELFDPSPVLHSNSALEESHDCLTLARANLEYGFAAVIADSHSRKAKYMQALALGLPCLAPQWAYTCLRKAEIVDWTSYLLCAGQSHVLGNAIRSRTLSPYDALDAKLAHILAHRDKLLAGEKLLLVQDQDHRKSRRETRQQYLFLALALGPSVLHRVYTVQEAGAVVREAEKSGSPFAWVYMDSATGTLEAVLAAASQETGKRKRRAVAARPVGGDLKVLTDELMIQSLILGRMVEGDEMG